MRAHVFHDVRNWDLHGGRVRPAHGGATARCTKAAVAEINYTLAQPMHIVYYFCIINLQYSKVLEFYSTSSGRDKVCKNYQQDPGKTSSVVVVIIKQSSWPEPKAVIICQSSLTLLKSSNILDHRHT